MRSEWKSALRWMSALVLAGAAGCSNVSVHSTPPPADFSLSSNTASLTLSPGGSAQPVSVSASAINGFTGTIQVAESGLPSGVTASPASFSLTAGGSQKVSLTASSKAVAGSSTFTFTAISGSLSHSISVTVTVTSAPDFSLDANVDNLNLVAGGSAQSVSISAMAMNGFSGSIQVTTSGLGSGVTASPASLSLTPGESKKVDLTAAASAVAGSGKVVFTGKSGSLSHAISVKVTVTAAATPNFSLDASVPGLSIVAGGSGGSVSISDLPLNGFAGTVDVAVSGLPAAVAASPASFSLAPGGSKKVSLTAAASAAAGSAKIVFTGTSGSLKHTVSVELTVTTSVTTTLYDSTTYHYDVARDGLNANETTLTPANVKATTFGLLRVLPVDGNVDAEAVYLANLTAGGKMRNVVYAATENDSLYAFDADTGEQIWKHSVLGANETPSDDHGCGQISPEIGITSTPVIDRKAGPNGTIFVVGMSLDTGGNYHQRLHAIDVTTGAELAGTPTEIKASYPGNGANSSNGSVIFDPAQYAERSGLLLLNGVIYMGWTSHCDQDPYTGWLMGYSESTLQQTAVLNLTPNGSEGSIWMTGAGLAADSTGSIYFLDANGTFDPTLNGQGFPVNGDFGNGFIKVSTAGGKLAVADYFEPYGTVQESADDEDLGSGGAMLLPDMTDNKGNVHHLAVGAGKDSNIYVVDRDNMGKFNPNNDNAIYEEIDGAINGGVWSMPAYFNNTVYYGSVGDNLKAFPITNARLATSPSAQSANGFGYPGTTPSISANGTKNGIVWAVENSSPAVLHAFDAGTLQEIYNSNQAANGRDNFGNGNKFITPMILNGKVFIGTPNGMAVFGLLP